MIFALNWCSSVSKFEHAGAQAMGIGITFSGQTGPLGRTETEPFAAAVLPDLFGPDRWGDQNAGMKGNQTSLDSTGSPR